MFRSVLILAILFLLYNCKEDASQERTTASPEDIIKKSIEVAGGDLFDHSDINFDFRDIHYRALRNQGRYELTRHFEDSLSEVKDVLSNSGFERFRDDKKISLSDSLTSLYSNSVNSVHYFSVLPYSLDGKAVHHNYLELKTINGRDYHKIKVTFSEEGGGEDFDDVFIYWIDKDSFYIDYLAYSFKEIDDSLGFRFREAYNARNIKNLRFVDYKNYKPVTPSAAIEVLDDMFMTDQLQLLSKIELENIQVDILN
ncbi:DUF6503 family protein [Gelidibacter maritimus]|uniref:DUF6503 family protein n=1 Tax=Gelidibacter maritimus TaxID=2761487 RepID=UPI001F1B5873|nr:DUF6503 family protein [Gelidibacter maritimus]